MPTPREIAEAFSSHRFDETYEHLAADVRWNLVGADPIHGRDAVIALCRATLTALEGTTTDYLRFLSIADTSAVAVDSVARYVAGDGSTNLVGSCDVYEIEDGLVTAITSYTVELAPGSSAGSA